MTSSLDPSNLSARPYLFERKDRSKGKYCARFVLKDGRTVTRSFQTTHARTEFIRESRLGATDESFNYADWQRWLRIKAECERNEISPESLLAYAVEAKRSEIEPMTLGTLVTEYRTATAGRAKEYKVHIRHTLVDLLLAQFGKDRLIGELTQRDIQHWLDSFGEISALTIRNRRNIIRAMFRWAVAKGVLARSPVEGVSIPNPKRKTPGILTPAQLRTIFTANASHPDACALIALGAFAGLRTSSVERLEPKEIRLADKQLFFPAEKFKTGRAHLIEHAPENLWPWLERVDVKTLFAKTPRNLRRIRADAIERSGVKPPHNALRHSFATYKCALNGSAEKASYILGHSNPAEIWQSYKGIATKAEAKAWFAITPERVL